LRDRWSNKKKIQENGNSFSAVPWQRREIPVRRKEAEAVRRREAVRRKEATRKKSVGKEATWKQSNCFAQLHLK
jgi:hypothetical protein